MVHCVHKAISVTFINSIEQLLLFISILIVQNVLHILIRSYGNALTARLILARPGFQDNGPQVFCKVKTQRPLKLTQLKMSPWNLSPL